MSPLGLYIDIECVCIHQENSVPGHLDPYEWEPCPRKNPPPYGPVHPNRILHWLDQRCNVLAPGAAYKDLWLKRLQKKLNDSITNCNEDLPEAWGIHIIDGADKVAMLWTVICVLAVCLAPVAAYVVLTKDIQGASGTGGLIVAVLTILWMAMKIEEWK
ncbi:MAG: hypothetical protein MMC33_009522 [Icmadophila ericetorum]|nr:hypothetical protein [Icmadophila ericetorum]